MAGAGVKGQPEMASDGTDAGLVAPGLVGSSAGCVLAQDSCRGRGCLGALGACWGSCTEGISGGTSGRGDRDGGRAGIMVGALEVAEQMLARGCRAGRAPRTFWGEAGLTGSPIPGRGEAPSLAAHPVPGTLNLLGGGLE